MEREDVKVGQMYRMPKRHSYQTWGTFSYPCNVRIEKGGARTILFMFEVVGYVGAGGWCTAAELEILAPEINPELEALKTSHAKMAEQIKELEAKLTKEAEASERPSLAIGQVWKHESGHTYLVTNYQGGFNLVGIDGYNSWSGDKGFGRSDANFTYLGMASDLLTIKEPTK